MPRIGGSRRKIAVAAAISTLAVALGVGVALAVMGSEAGARGTIPVTTTTTTTTVPPADTEVFAEVADRTVEHNQSVSLKIQVMGRNPIDGTVAAKLYGDGDTTCTGTPAYSEDVAVATSGAQYETQPINLIQPGTYRWVASYGGNQNNNPSSTQCGDPGTIVTVKPDRRAVIELKVVPENFKASEKNQPLGPALRAAHGSSSNFPAAIKITTNRDGIVHFSFRPVGGDPAPGDGSGSGFNAQVEGGGDSVPITGKIRGKKLKPGKYKVRANPVNNNGVLLSGRRAPFRILQP